MRMPCVKNPAGVGPGQPNRSRASMGLAALVAAGIAGVLAAGCATTIPEEQIERERLQTEFRNLQADVQRLSGRLDELDVGQKEMHNQLRGSAELDARNREACDRRCRELAEQLRRLDEAREADKKDTIEKLSAQVADLINRYSSGGGTMPRGGGRPAPPAAGEGRVHVVARGETLSWIAQKYGVSAETILQANRLKNSNLIRVGQRLAIP